MNSMNLNLNFEFYTVITRPPLNPTHIIYPRVSIFFLWLCLKTTTTKTKHLLTNGSTMWPKLNLPYWLQYSQCPNTKYFRTVDQPIQEIFIFIIQPHTSITWPNNGSYKTTDLDLHSKSPWQGQRLCKIYPSQEDPALSKYEVLGMAGEQRLLQ